jgi:hypothetical protein
MAWARLQPQAQGNRVNGDVQTLAREVTYHPDLKQLLFSPLEEQASLRREVLGTSHNKGISLQQNLTLGPWEGGNQSDAQIYIEIPKGQAQATLYVSVEAHVRIKFYVDFGQKKKIQSKDRAFYEVEVGMLTDDPYPSAKDTLRLFEDEDFLELRLFLDHTITEAYWQGGRVAMTVSSPLTSSTAITLSTDTPNAHLKMQNASVWKMAGAWVSDEDIRLARL